MSSQGGSDDQLGTRSLFRLACLEVYRDNQVDEEERVFLQRLQQLLRIPPEMAKEILAEAKAYCATNPSPEAGPLEPVTLFDLACQLAWADGELEDREKMILIGLGKFLELAPDRCEAILASHAPAAPAPNTAAASVEIDPAMLAAATRPLPPREQGEAPRPALRLPAPPAVDLGLEKAGGGVVGWLSKAVGVKDPWQVRIRAANGCLAIIHGCLRFLYESEARRDSISDFSWQIIEKGEIQRMRESVRHVGFEACMDLLGNDGFVAAISEPLRESGPGTPAAHLLTNHLMPLWAALNALHAPKGTYAKMRPQYEYLADLVDVVRRDVPGIIPPFMALILHFLARDMEASKELDASLARRIGHRMSPKVQVVVPEDLPVGTGSGDYAYPDLMNPDPEYIQSFIQLDNTPRSGQLSLKPYAVFAAAVALGFEKVHYAAESRPSDGAFYWISKEHGQQIGRALRPSLREWGLSLTMFEEGAAEALVAAAPEGIRLDELTISHKSGDEVTVSEARAVAQLAHKLGAATLHLWAGEFDPGSLDALAAELESLGNTTLTTADICDVSRPEPEDVIHHPALLALVAKNRERLGAS